MKASAPSVAAPTVPQNSLVEIAPVPLAFIDRNRRFVYANEAGAQQVGRSSEELIGLTVAEAMPKVWPDLTLIFDRVFDGETIVNLDVDLSELSSEPREWIASFHPVREDGEVVAVACTSVDVSELREVERSLQDRNDVFAMLARVNLAVSQSDSKEVLFREICEIAYGTGKFRYAWVGEPDGNAIKGVASAGMDTDGRRAFEADAPSISTDAEDPRSSGPTARAFLTGEVAVENDYFGSPATAIWQGVAKRLGFRSSAAFPIHQHGRVAAVLSLYVERRGFFTPGLIETLSEITPGLSLALDRFEMERRRKLNESELMLRDRALTAATQGVAITDAQDENRVRYVTPALAELTGYSNEEFLGRKRSTLPGADTDPEDIAKLRQAVADGGRCEIEMLAYRKNGESFWDRVSISPIFDDSGALTNSVVVHTDVTERLRLENEVRQAQKMEAVGQLAGGVAHDFNNVLTVIRGTADLALAELEDGSTRDDLLLIDRASEHAAHLTRQLLAFSRQQVLQPQSTDLNTVVSETSELIARLVGDNIELRQDLARNLDPVLVDRAQFQQVIINLAINGRDAMPDGGCLRLRTSACHLDESHVENRRVPAAGNYALVEISDSGVGMDEQTQSKVFDPFFTTKTEGTGLGLATVYGIVSQSGGLIEVESEQNVGTTFRVYLPTTTEAIAPSRSSLASAVDSLDGDETILHVDDAEMLRPLVARALGRRGYNVISASNADEAIELARVHPGKIDLVLTDVLMPGMNGRELAEVLLAEYPDLRVLFSSGYPADIVLRQGIAEAEVNFIEKPFLAKDLVSLIRSILDQSDARHD